MLGYLPAARLALLALSFDHFGTAAKILGRYISGERIFPSGRPIFRLEIIQTNDLPMLIYLPLLSWHTRRMGTMKGNSVLTSKIESEIELLQRHVQMLKAIMDNEPIGIIRLSELLVYPQHKVRYSLRIL
jgi:hypothetical protein